MLYAYPHQGGAMSRLAEKYHSGSFSRAASLLRMADVAVIVAALLIWPLLWVSLASPIHLNFDGAEGTQSCVYLGRAGSHCSARSGFAAQDDSKQHCVSLGRAGQYCPPERSSH